MADDEPRPAPGGITAPALLDALASYRTVRQELLATTGLGRSNRDPLAEVAEHLVRALYGGRLAESRVQAGYDLVSATGEYIQVKYLANPLGDWPNEHTVRSIPGVDRYAIVLYEGFEVTGVVAFPPVLTLICAQLGKHHPDQATTLQFTRRNWWAVRDNADTYRTLGTDIWLPPFHVAA